jgi:hypothetical protein
MNVNGPNFHIEPSVVFSNDSTRPEVSYSSERGLLFRPSFPADKDISNTAIPNVSNFYSTRLNVNPFGSGSPLVPNVAQTAYLHSNVPNDRDIDGMFGPNTFGLSIIDNSHGNISPLVSEFTSVMKFDSAASDSTVNENGWDWNNMTESSTDHIPTLFPSKSKRSSNSHSIGLGGVKLDL